MDIRALGDRLAYLGPFIHQISLVCTKWRLGRREQSMKRGLEPPQGCISTKWNIGTIMELLPGKSPLHRHKSHEFGGRNKLVLVRGSG